MAAEKFFPFRSVSGDRKYSAEDWAAYFALFIGNGIFYSTADRLKVVATEGMEVKVGMGAGFVNGRMYILETDKSIVLDTADGVMNRIDRVVLRCDYVNRKISTEVIKGSYSAVPTAAELTRNADVYELALADVYVGAGVVTITASAITDQRLNTELCGIVTGLVDQADTTEIFNQFQAYMQEFMTDAKEDFQEWFDAIRNTLAGDAAGNILTKLEDLEKEVAKIPIIEVNNTNTVTEEGIALDARQANPTIEGTMAHDIATAQTDIEEINNKLSNVGKYSILLNVSAKDGTAYEFNLSGYNFVIIMLSNANAFSQTLHLPSGVLGYRQLQLYNKADGLWINAQISSKGSGKYAIALTDVSTYTQSYGVVITVIGIC